jgi:hypothetical protein
MGAESNNMEIWNQVCTTEKEFTKEATGKGFACTSINPNYIYKKLTELFGPCGIGWGYRILSEEYKEGQKALHHDKQKEISIENREILHVVKVGFWYEKDSQRSVEIEAFGQTYFVRLNSGGWKMDEEAPKKSLTDALCKAASMIGVSADIYSGKWDGHKDQSGKKTKTTTKTTGAKDSSTKGVLCPKCNKGDAVIKSKFKEGEFVCYDKKDGCGFKFTPDSEKKSGGLDDIPMGTPPNGKFISDNDRKKLFAKSKAAQWTDDDLKKLLDGSYGIKSTKEIPVEKFDEILSYID